VSAHFEPGLEHSFIQVNLFLIDYSDATMFWSVMYYYVENKISSNGGDYRQNPQLGYFTSFLDISLGIWNFKKISSPSSSSSPGVKRLVDPFWPHLPSSLFRDLPVYWSMWFVRFQ
jgi:hypothetical protein